MLNHINALEGAAVLATDGEIGHVRDAFFDDQAWAIRYLVVDAGSWLSGREVLISPFAVTQPLGSGKTVGVALTRNQVKTSPPIDTHRPVSRRHEQENLRHYGYPNYWAGGGLWAFGELPMLPMPTADGGNGTDEADAAAREAAVPPEDVHLRSSLSVTGYHIQATDESIGHVQDFVFDDESWAIRYLVVDTRNWWPGGTKVLVATHWIDRIDWAESTVRVALTREQVQASPVYSEGAPIQREYEARLHDAYNRVGYWD
jgi:uncharacterized protein YrrD